MAAPTPWIARRERRLKGDRFRSIAAKVRRKPLWDREGKGQLYHL